MKDAKDVKTTFRKAFLLNGFAFTCFTFFTVCLVAAAMWTPQSSGVTSRLRGVSAVSAKIAWASGSGATVLRTDDGGATWTKPHGRGRSLQLGIIRARHRHANHREGGGIEVNLPTDDVRICAEPPLPRLVTEHGDGTSRTWPVIVGDESAAELQRNAEDVEVIAADHTRLFALGARVIHKVHGTRSDGGQVHGCRSVPEESVFSRRHAARASVLRRKHDHDAARIRHRPRLEQNGVDDAEDTRIESNDDHECSARGKCEAGAVPQRVDRMAQILPHGLQPRREPYPARGLAGQCGVPKRSRSMPPSIAIIEAVPARVAFSHVTVLFKLLRDVALEVAVLDASAQASKEVAHGSGRLQYALNRGHELVELLAFGGEVLSAGLRDRVVARLPVVLRRCPLGVEVAVEQ